MKSCKSLISKSLQSYSTYIQKVKKKPNVQLTKQHLNSGNSELTNLITELELIKSLMKYFSVL